MLLTTSILYMGCKWILMSTFMYYMRFLLNVLSFCAIAIFLIMIFVWLLRKCSNRIHIVLGFYLVWLGFGHLLYIVVWALFFSPLPPPLKKNIYIYLVAEGNQIQIRISYKLHCQQKKAKIFKFYNIIRLHVWDLLWSFSQNFTLYY